MAKQRKKRRRKSRRGTSGRRGGPGLLTGMRGGLKKAANVASGKSTPSKGMAYMTNGLTLVAIVAITYLLVKGCSP